MKKYYVEDEGTGELSIVDNPVVELYPGDVVRRNKQNEFIQQKAYNNGSFIWMIFNYGEELFPNLSLANLTRLMYAVTFCDYDGRIMSKKGLQEKMGLEIHVWYKFWKEISNYGILYEENECIYINKEIFQKGKIQTDANYTRLFCKYIQGIYESCDSASNHKSLAYLFKILPFVNRKNNVVCLNQTEQDEDLAIPMTIGDFCDAIGYNKTHARRLAKELLSIRVNGELPIIFVVPDMDIKKWNIIINPKLYFGGDYNNAFKEQRQLFIREAKKYQKRLQSNGTK